MCHMDRSAGEMLTFGAKSAVQKKTQPRQACLMVAMNRCDYEPQAQSPVYSSSWLIEEPSVFAI